jgi:hypothetical protein
MITNRNKYKRPVDQNSRLQDVPGYIHQYACEMGIALLLPLLLIAGCNGSSEHKTTHGGNYQWQESGDKWREELLTYAVDSLNHMEKFQNQETFIHIFRQIYTWQQFSEKENNTALPDPLTAAWPETEMLQQIVDRLNQWIRTQKPPSDWKPDPIIDSLPEPYKQLHIVEGLDKTEFSAFDGYALHEAVLLRDAATWARGDALDDLSRAKNLFDWTIRNIQLEKDAQERIMLFPWEAMVFGRGTAMERAWVFVLMARQEGLDAVLLAVVDPADNGPIAKVIKPWCVAVLIDKKAYLFDPALGMPIPAKDGVKHDAGGRLEIQPATLEEVVADESLLKQLDIDSTNTYPIKQSDIKNLAALVECSPAYLSYRMKLIESRLVGNQKMILTTSATAQAERWKSVPGIDKARLWIRPYETIRRRTLLSPAGICNHLGEFLSFYALPNAPLSKGRLMQLKGDFIGLEGATQFYQSARPSNQELIYLSDLPSIQELDKRQRELTKIKSDLVKANNDPSTPPSRLSQQVKADVDDKMADIDLAKTVKKLEEEYTNFVVKMTRFQSKEEETAAKADFQRQALQMMLVNILQGKQDATYWLGLIAYQRGNYNSAIDYLLKRTLEMHPDGPWGNGARYNLALAVEASGEIDRAVMMYQSDPDAPDLLGRLLRAKWLGEKEGK